VLPDDGFLLAAILMTYGFGGLAIFFDPLVLLAQFLTVKSERTE
jgi:hypothetical protein